MLGLMLMIKIVVFSFLFQKFFHYCYFIIPLFLFIKCFSKKSLLYFIICSFIFDIIFTNRLGFTCFVSLIFFYLLDFFRLKFDYIGFVFSHFIFKFISLFVYLCFYSLNFNILYYIFYDFIFNFIFFIILRVIVCNKMVNIRISFFR